MTTLFFNNGTSHEVDLDGEALWMFWQAHKKNIATIRFKIGLLHVSFDDHDGFDAERTFREIIISSFPTTIPPESGVTVRTPNSSTMPSPAY